MHDHECTCHPGYVHDTLIPQVGIITDIRQETPDVKTVRIEPPQGGKFFEHMPGQCAMICVPGVSEAMFSITSSPTNKPLGMFLLPVSCTISGTSIHSSSGFLSIRFSPLNLFLTSTV